MEKEVAVETVSPVPSDHDGEKQQVQDPTWKPGFLARFPWLAFVALLTVLACAAASLVVLVTSNGTSENRWPKDAHPNVLISVFNSVENICFAIAIGSGIAVAWWRKALQGSSIADLHRSWAFSTSSKEIVVSFKYFNVIALAALTAKLTFIDGILMQRATSYYVALDKPVNVTNIVGFSNTTFPVTGTVNGLNEQPGLMMHWMGDTLKMWSQTGGTYPNQWKGCEGVCYVDVPGIGFAFDCEDPAQSPIDYGLKLAAEDAAQNGIGPLPEVNLFNIEFAAFYADGTNISPDASSSYLQMNVSYTQVEAATSAGSCPGTLWKQQCKLRPAIINYPVQIQNTTGGMAVSIGASKPHTVNGTIENLDLHRFNQTLQQQKSFELLQLLDILESHPVNATNKNSSLAGLELAFMMYLRGKSTLKWDPTIEGFVISQMGHSANYMTDPPPDASSCSFYYNNPLDSYEAPNGLFTVPSLIAKINQITFGLATDISRDDRNNDYSKAKEYNGTVYTQSIHYQTHFAYMWGAIASTLACVLLILPVFWGFWELGRKVTLGPFEIAHAFRSPVIGQASTATTNELIKEVGDHEVRYGPIVAGDGRGRFAVAESQNVAEAPGASPRSSWRASWLSSS